MAIANAAAWLARSLFQRQPVVRIRSEYQVFDVRFQRAPVVRSVTRYNNDVSRHYPTTYATFNTGAADTG